MYQAGIKHPLRATHFLIGDFEEETEIHSHDYLVEWNCTTADLDENGFSVDIALMEQTLADICNGLDGQLLNDLPFFADCQSSVENVARFLHLQLFERSIPDINRVIRSEIKIWESDTAWAAYISESG